MGICHAAFELNLSFGNTHSNGAQGVLSERDASGQRQAESLAIQSASVKMDVDQLRSTNAALQVSPAFRCMNWQLFC